MAVGKNKRLTKGGGKKGGKKKTSDPFLKKEWYDIKAPSVFSIRNCGKTLVSRTQGTKIATEELNVFKSQLDQANRMGWEIIADAVRQRMGLLKHLPGKEPSEEMETTKRVNALVRDKFRMLKEHEQQTKAIEAKCTKAT